MAAWVTIFCKRSVADVTPEAILEGIGPADFHTLAEGYGIEDEDQVNAALANLRFEPQDGKGFREYRLRYRPGNQRPLVLSRRSDPGQLVEYLVETLEEIQELPKKAADRITAHLRRFQECVDIEMGWNQTEDMGAVLAYEIARWIASRGDGILRDHDGEWWDLTRRGVFRRIGP